MKTMKILGKDIYLRDDYLNIHDLKFLVENPRVYACTYGVKDFAKFTPEEQQEKIYKKLIKQSSVKNLTPEIVRHGGLMESILVRWDTKEVVEGNSRLAVYRQLHDDKKEGEWDLIPCDIIESLSDDQQAAFLNQIHVKGKTQWTTYEKANFAYIRRERGMSFPDIAKLFGESEVTIRLRVNTIKMMKANNDPKQLHFSYYDVLSRNPAIKNGLDKVEGKGWKNLLDDIKNFGLSGKGDGEQTNEFTALDLRKKMPVVLGKLKVLKKYIAREIDLDDAFQRARISHVEDNVKKATSLLNDVSNDEIEKLERNRFNAFAQAVKKLDREVKTIVKMTNTIDDKK